MNWIDFLAPAFFLLGGGIAVYFFFCSEVPLSDRVIGYLYRRADRCFRTAQRGR